MTVKKVVIGIAVFLGLMLLLQNTEVVAFRFLFWELRMSRIILFPLVMLFGVAMGFFWGRKSWDW